MTARERRGCTSLRTLVLDAGHGGHDSGAVGPAGLMEKDLVLDVTGGWRGCSRTSSASRSCSPATPTISSRCATAPATPTASAPTSSSRSTPTRIAWSPRKGWRPTSCPRRRPTTPRARWPRSRTAWSSSRSPRPARAASRIDVVKTILWDLAQSEFQWESSRLAETVLDSMTQSLKIPNRGVKQAGFYVLGGAAMPAILIEIGFVTNPKEERRLKETRYRDEIARAILAGLVGIQARLESSGLRRRRAGPAERSRCRVPTAAPPTSFAPIAAHARLPAAPGGLGARRVRRHQGDLHRHGRGQGAALPEGPGAGLGDRRVRRCCRARPTRA